MRHLTDFSVIIPARLQSSRLPRKVLMDISGLPMLVRVARQAQKSSAKRVVIATDSEEIVATCKTFDLEYAMTKSSHQSGSERLAEAVELLNMADDEIVVNVQGDEPLIDPSLIDQLAHQLAESKTPMATLAHPIHSSNDYNNPNIVKVVLNRAKEAMYFSRSLIPFIQKPDPDHTVLRHIGLYAYRADFLKTYQKLAPSPLEKMEALEQIRVLWYGYAITVLVIEQATSIGVDTLQDLHHVINLINTNKELS